MAEGQTDAGRRPDPPTWTKVFLRSLRKTMHVERSARAAGVSAYTPYKRRKTDAAFAKAWDKAWDYARTRRAAQLEEHAFSLAKKGVVKPTKYGDVREYPVALIIFMLKKNIDRYRDRLDMPLGGDDVVRAFAEQIRDEMLLMDGGGICPKPDGAQ